MPPMPGDPNLKPFLSSGDGNSKARQYSSLKFQENFGAKQKIRVASEALKDQGWDDCVTALQYVLNEPSDSFIEMKEKDANGRDIVKSVSVRFEAYTLLQSMPEEGLTRYEDANGNAARELLNKAIETGRQEYLQEAANKYLHTKAGSEANEMLATVLLDRGQYFMAALRFEKQLQLNPKRFKVNDATLFKTALAYRRAGESKKAETAWKAFETKLKAQGGGLQVGKKLLALETLTRIYESTPKSEMYHPFDWPSIAGNLANSAQAAGSPPVIDQHLWRRDLFDSSEGPTPGGTDAKNYITNSIPKNDGAILPGSYPIAANKILIYRTPSDLRAVYLTENGKNKPGDICWVADYLDGPLGVVLDDPKTRTQTTNWIQEYMRTPGFSSVLYENTLVNSLSTDHQYIYCVDDLSVPALPNVFANNPNMGFNPNMNIPNLPERVKEMVLENTLLGFQFDGRVYFSLGGGSIRANKHPEASDKLRKDPFNESHFLGPPISIANKLYVLNEKNPGAAQMHGESELRLVCLDPSKVVDAQPHVVDIQPLGTIRTNDRVTHNPARRTNAAFLAYSDGILVCPTHTGEILGIDLLSKSLIWSFAYRDQAFPNTPVVPPNMRFQPQQLHLPAYVPNWKSAPPVIHDGKVVFTAPDSQFIHCFNLRDGSYRWSKRQAPGDLYFGGIVNETVIVVGQNAVRGLALNDGTLRWSVNTGDAPAGRGVANKNVYFLPLVKGDLIAIDADRGMVKSRNRSQKAGSMLGNLVFSDGAVIAVNPKELIAFPQLMAKLELANAELDKAPKNPNNLFIRGELFLADGQVQKAVDDFHTALKNSPTPDLTTRIKNRLYDGLSDLLQTDFNQASARYLEEFESLCSLSDDANEKEERQAHFFRIVGQGREIQGNLVDAFSLYRKFGSLPIHVQRGGIPSLEDPSQKIPVDVWLRGRISGMIAKASKEQKAPLEAKIAEEWRTVQAERKPDSIRSFINMFDVPFKVGRDARLEMADALIRENDKSLFLEAELYLNQLRGEEYRLDPTSGGKALAALAVLEERKSTTESMKQAAEYYRQLKREFPTAIVRDDKGLPKTGLDLFNDLATDKRFWPYLEESTLLWSDAKLAAREIGPSGNPLPDGVNNLMLTPDGEIPLALENARLFLNSNFANPVLRLYDLGAMRERWAINLPTHPQNQQYFAAVNAQPDVNQKNYNASRRFFKVKGNIAVVQAGVMVHGIDLENNRTLWQHSLLELPPGLVNVTFKLDADGAVEVTLTNPNNSQLRSHVGFVGMVQPSYVAFVSNRGLVVVDPLKGHIQWKKLDVSPLAHMFGDDQYICLVEPGDAGATGSVRVLRAADGQQVKLPDYAPLYRNRVAVLGRKVLSAIAGADELELKLHDLIADKTLWSVKLPKGSVTLKSDDAQWAGTLNPANGDVKVYESHSGKLLLESNVVQGRVTLQDLAKVREPLLVGDADRFYVALNQPIDGTRIEGGVVRNNFSTGLRCLPVNGWVAAFYRNDGARRIDGVDLTWKKNEMAWHSFEPVLNQWIVMDQFQQLPFLLFTSRYHEKLTNPRVGNQWMSATQSLHKVTGKGIFQPDAQPTDIYRAQFYVLKVDVKEGTISMLGNDRVVQHYVDDGRKRDNAPAVGFRSAGPMGYMPAPPPGMGVAPPIRRFPVVRPGIQVPAPVPVPLPAPAPKLK